MTRRTPRSVAPRTDTPERAVLRRLATAILAGIILACGGCATLSSSGVNAEQLRCEHRTDPLGIDEGEPSLGWVLTSRRRGETQSAYRILVAGSEEALRGNHGDFWDTGRVSSNQSIQIPYKGRPLKSGTRYHWKVRVWDKQGRPSAWSKPAWWEMGLLAPEDWAAVWINDGKSAPLRDEDFYRDDPAPMFRREFVIHKPVRRARLYISGLGYYEASLNGQRVGDRVLDPGWTTYSKKVLYSTYDITSMLHAGPNAIGVMVGNGWYNPLPLRMWGGLNLREHLTVGRPRLIAQLAIEHADGTSQSIATNTSWKVRAGPVLRNNVYLGEVYDARREAPDWDLPGLDDASWGSAAVAGEPIGVLRAQSAPPIRATPVVKPRKISEPSPGVFIFDMGQNFTGLARLQVNGPAGTEVKMRYGELLYENGTLNVMTSTCGQIKAAGIGGPGAPAVAWQSDTYILKGAGREVYTPRFTFRGFRYVEVVGCPGTPTLDTIVGIRINADVEEVGSFECSNPTFDRIQQMVRWSFLSNLGSVQMDCPHREKFGYGGDAVCTAVAHCFNFDMARFYAKTVSDFADAARPNGGLTETAPYVGIADGGLGEGTGPIGWMIVHPHLLGELYRFYGDRRLLEQQYETARRSLEFIRSKAKDHIISVGISDHESIDPKPVALTSTAFYYDYARMLSQFAHALERDKDAEQYAVLAQEIKRAFISKFLESGTGRFDSHTQACQAFALYYDLVPANEHEAAVNVLLDEVMVRHKGHLSTGIFATELMLDVLTRTGRADVAYAIVSQKTFPGWGHMLENGATTMWEHWAFSDNTFSHNHSMFGSVSEWLFEAIAGIRPHPNAIGFDRIIIQPNIVGDLTWAKGSYDSIRGRVSSHWRLRRNALALNVTIPVGATAAVYVPAQSPEKVKEGGLPAAAAEHVKYVGMERGCAVYEIGSGDYSFISEGVKASLTTQ